MDEAKRFIQSQEAIEGDTAFIAYTQTHGRGRRGRTWVNSPPGNLHLSLMVPFKENLCFLGEFSFISAVALREVISGFLPLKYTVMCKWPNDILAEGRKIAGILLEKYERSWDKSSWLVIGVGVNIETCPEDAGALRATCLRNFSSASLTPEEITEKFYSSFDRWRALWHKEGFKVIRGEWMKWAAGLGKMVKISLPREGQDLEGTFCELDFDGAFVLETSDRKRVRIHAADIWMF